MVLCVSEDAPFSEVQRSFRRMVKTTHPDGGGDACSFDAVVRAFEDIRRTLLRQPALATPLRRSTPYDGWLRPCPPAPNWGGDDGPTAASTATRPPASDFSAVLLEEMSKVEQLVTA
jgi:hypothetical protein